jgi:hypothetical protein
MGRSLAGGSGLGCLRGSGSNVIVGDFYTRWLFSGFAVLLLSILRAIQAGGS